VPANDLPPRKERRTNRKDILAPSNLDGLQASNQETITVRNVDSEAINYVRHAAVDSKRSLGEIVTEALRDWRRKQEASGA
jgi:hypothetical protein